jgi:hypothetical protein
MFVVDNFIGGRALELNYFFIKFNFNLKLCL